MIENHDIHKVDGRVSDDGQQKRAYLPPRVLSAELMEAQAEACSPGSAQGPGKPGNPFPVCAKPNS